MQAQKNLVPSMNGWVYHRRGIFFFIKVNKGRNNAGVGLQLVFQVLQHIRYEKLLKSLVTLFECGPYVKESVVKFVQKFILQ